MPTKEELERRNLTELAVLCQKVADDPSIARQKARQLHEEWVRLIQATTPPLSALKEQQEIEAQMESLKKRMAEFLAATL